GTRLSGELTRVGEDHLSMISPGIREPLSLPLSQLRSLVLLKHEDLAVSLFAAGRAGRLEMNGLLLRGRLTNGREESEASCLVWHPEHSETASPLRPGVSGRIVYRDPPPPAPKPTPQQLQQRAQRPVGFADAFLQALAGGPQSA